MKRLFRVALVLASLGAAQGLANAQTPDARIDAALERAADAGIPVTLLESKIAEGRAKGVPLEVIAAAVERRADALEAAASAVADQDLGPAGLNLAAEAIEGGVSETVLRTILETAPQERRQVAVAALAHLVSEGQAPEHALDVVRAALGDAESLTALLAISLPEAAGEVSPGPPAGVPNPPGRPDGLPPTAADHAGPPSGIPPGPPDGVPSGPPDTPGPPDGVPSGPPDTTGPPDGVPPGPPDGVPPGPPDGVPAGPPETPGPPEGTPAGPPETPGPPDGTPGGSPGTPGPPEGVPGGAPDNPGPPDGTPGGPPETPAPPEGTPGGPPENPGPPDGTPGGPPDNPGPPDRVPGGAPETPGSPATPPTPPQAGGPPS